VAAPGKQPVGNDLRFQATIGKTARQCSFDAGVITARIGIQGRVIAGPAGARPQSRFPCASRWCRRRRRKDHRTKAYQTTVNMTESGSERSR